MQLVMINWGIVSTCRKCDRQTYHPHISIQLKVRRQEELSSRVQTSRQALALSPVLSATLLQLKVWAVLKEKKQDPFPLVHASFKRKTIRCLWKYNEISWVPDFNPTREQMDTWNGWNMNEWNPSFQSPKEVNQKTSDYAGYVPPWTLELLRETENKRKRRTQTGTVAASDAQISSVFQSYHPEEPNENRLDVIEWKTETGDKGRDQRRH